MADAGRHLGRNFWNGNDRKISIRHLADSDLPNMVNIRYINNIFKIVIESFKQFCSLQHFLIFLIALLLTTLFDFLESGKQAIVTVSTGFISIFCVLKFVLPPSGKKLKQKL